jgi:hypothetical protein
MEMVSHDRFNGEMSGGVHIPSDMEFQGMAIGLHGD